MTGRLGAALVASLMLITGLVVLGAPTEPARAARMCPPVTLDDLFPPPTQPPSTTPSSSTTTPDTGSTTTTSETTITTAPSETTSTTSAGTVTTPTTAPSSPAPSSTPTSTPAAAPAGCDAFRYDMSWPLAGAGQMISGFGSDRDRGARHHQGVDISAPKLTPVVAVADGVVMSVTQEVGTEDCCWMSVRHDDGWQSYYVHLNNDSWGSDDGLGVGVRTDLVEGMEVDRGEVIGWLGDSGNAEETTDHLHFELRAPAGVAIDPGPSLRSAQSEAVLLDPQPSWPYADDDGTATEWLAASLLSQGLLLPCEETMTSFCPDRLASPTFATDIVGYFSGKTPPALPGRYQSMPVSIDPEKSTEGTAGPASGCEPVDECLAYGLPRTELARIAAWARIDALVTELLPESPDPDGGSPTVNLPSAADAEARLRAEGALDVCNPPLDDHVLLSREETLLLLASWAQGSNPEPCFDGLQRTR